MDYRNPSFTENGLIDCEIDHPDFGWMPFTVNPLDDRAGFDVAALDAAIRVAGGIAAYEPPAPSSSDVDAERDRRILVGKTFTLAGYGDVAVQGREVDQRNMLALATAAIQAISAGAGSVTMQFRAADNVIHTLTWAQMLTLCNASTAYVSAIYAASWALKDNPPIPGDYADDSRWPE